MMSQKTTFLLVQSGGNIRLTAPVDSFGLKVGDQMTRDPLSAPGEWTVIKVFEGSELAHVRALTDLVGHTAVAKMFEITVADNLVPA